MSRGPAPSRALTTCLLAAGWLAACAPGPRVLSRAPEPSAAVTAFTVTALQRQRASLALKLAVDNPGAPFKLVSADYEVFLDDRSFAVGTTALDDQIAGHLHSTVSLPIELAYLDIPLRIRTRVKANEPVRVVVRGKLQALRDDGGPASVPFDAEAEAVVAEDSGRPAP